MTIVNAWNLYGLKSSPFFQEELRAVPGAAYPVELLFVGREHELSRLGRQIGGSSSSRVMVQGQPGVGKTSFVNRLKSDLAADGVLTHDQPIRITSAATPLGFTADVLRVLLRIHTAQGLAIDRFWERAVRLVEGQDVLAGGVSLLSVGFQVEKARIAPDVAITSLYEVIAEALDRLHRQAGGPVLLHVDNLESLAAGDARAAAALLLDVRDYLMLPHAHWVFVGAEAIEKSVFKVYSQVSSIFPSAVTLSPLTSGDLQTLLRRRYDHLRLGKKQPLVDPIRVEDAAHLYEHYRGDLRNFLRLLSEAADLALGLDRVEPLPVDSIIRRVGPRYAEALETQLGQNDAGYLAAIITRRTDPADFEFRVTDAQKRLKVSQPGATGITSRLLSAGAIRVSRTQGKSTYYLPIGDARIAFGAADGESNQPAQRDSRPRTRS
jgi:AAA ATPase domain